MAVVTLRKLKLLVEFVKTFEANVHPLHNIEGNGECSCGVPHTDNSAGKHPRLDSWKEEASQDQKQITEWHKQWPRCNWGMLIPDYMVVIDCDKRSNGDEVYQHWRPKGESAPLTTVVETPTGGRHYYFRKPEGWPYEDGGTKDAVVLKGKGTDKVDVVFNRHNLLIPPSFREGREYTFVGKIIKAKDLPILPDWVPINGDAKGETGKGGKGRGRPRKDRFNPDDPRQIARLKDALTHLDFDAREVWYKICCAMGRGFKQSDKGFAILASWAQQSATYHYNDTRKFYTEDSKKGGDEGPSIQAILNMAREEGWEPSRDVPEKAFNILHATGTTNDTLQQMATALATHPNLFTKARHLVTISTAAEAAEELDDGAQRSDTAPIIQLANKGIIGYRLLEVANYYKENAKEEMVLSDPSDQIIEKFSLVTEVWDQKCKKLEGFLDHPMVLSDGSVIDDLGWNKETGLYMLSSGVNLGAIRNDMVCDEACAALKELMIPFGEFPFVNNADRAAFLSALFTIGTRYMFNEVPLFAMTAPAAGTGKSKLINAICKLWLGRPPTVRTLPQGNDEEFDKIMPGLLMSGDRVISFDNVSEGSYIRSSRLEQVLTSSHSAFRLMRENESTVVANRAVFFLTGNSIQFSTEMNRRVMRSHMDSHMERPELRTGFRCDPVDYVTENRGRMLNLAISLIASYLKSGSPQPTLKPKSMGSFEKWFRVMRGFILWMSPYDLGAALLTHDDMDTALDLQRSLIEELIIAYPEEEQKFRLADTVGKVEGSKELRAAFREVYPYKGAAPDAITLVKTVFSLIKGKTYTVEKRSVQLTFRASHEGRFWVLKVK